MSISKFSYNNGIIRFSVLINQIELKSTRTLQQNLEIITKLQNDFPNIVIQFFNEKNVLNTDHIFNACYFVEKAFFQKRNISNKKHIELLLYISTKRQIKQAIEDFGLTHDNINNNRLSYCIISSDDNFDEHKYEINNRMDAVDIEININDKSLGKSGFVRDYFKINDNKVNSVLRSYINEKDEEHYKIKALNDIICEKMALLNLEKT